MDDGDFTIYKANGITNDEYRIEKHGNSYYLMVDERSRCKGTLDLCKSMANDIENKKMTGGGGVDAVKYEVVNRNDKHYSKVGVSLHGWNLDERGRYYCTLQFPNGSVSTYGEGEVSPYQHKGMRFTDGGKIEYNNYGVPKGYLYLSEFRNHQLNRNRFEILLMSDSIFTKQASE
jgi:hypothetical protein